MYTVLGWYTKLFYLVVRISLSFWGDTSLSAIKSLVFFALKSTISSNIYMQSETKWRPFPKHFSVFFCVVICFLFIYIYSYYTEACSFHSLGCRYHIDPSKIMQCNQLTNRLYQYYICNTYTSAHGFWLGHKLEILLGAWSICLFDSCGSRWCYRDIPSFELVSN